MIKEFDVNGEIEVVTYESYLGSLQDVSLGRIDAVLNDRLAGLTMIKDSGLDIKFGGEPVKELFNAFPFVVSDENKLLIEAVDKALDEMNADGTLTAISNKWFEVDITQ